MGEEAESEKRTVATYRRAPTVFREQRVVTRCVVEFERFGRTVAASSEDLSTAGVFVRTEHLFPVNAELYLTLRFSNGEDLVMLSRVAHILTPTIAKALGREVGMGFQFVQHDEQAQSVIENYLAQVFDEIAQAPSPNSGAQVLIADNGKKRIERLTTALVDARFDVRSVADGADAYRAMRAQIPDIVLVGDDVATMDGHALVKRMRSEPELANIAVMMMSDDPSDLARLHAYRLGVRDFVPRPFTDEELVLRMMRIAVDVQNARTAVLRGALKEISPATLLSIFEFERKSGVLLAAHSGVILRMFLRDGQVVQVSGEGDARPPLDQLFDFLDWDRGRFEFAACDVEGDDHVSMSTQGILLEHARVRDEEGRERSMESSSGADDDGFNHDEATPVSLEVSLDDSLDDSIDVEVQGTEPGVGDVGKGAPSEARDDRDDFF